MALCTQTKQIVAYHIGKGFQADCENFYSKLVEEYLDLKSYSDCNSCYESVFSSMTHRCTSKKEGKTNHIERFNLTLRQKLSRLIRKTLSYSKSLENLEASLGIFIYDYNLKILKKHPM